MIAWKDVVRLAIKFLEGTISPEEINLLRCNIANGNWVELNEEKSDSEKTALIQKYRREV